MEVNKKEMIEFEQPVVTLGSLFDGSGTCPLAATMCGAVPVWASEIEEFPVKVTQKNFPDMKHYGDITQMSGYEIEPVDIVAGGESVSGSFCGRTS